MDLSKLFEAQKVLMDRIEKEHPPEPGEDRFNKRILALLVEIGECANEWRGFKFWKVKPEPTEKLLEEYVDGLHFVLEMCIHRQRFFDRVNILQKVENIEMQFIYVMDIVTDLFSFPSSSPHYFELVQAYLGLGEMLGFAWNQIETAYFDKLAVNHERQDSGY